MGGSSSASSKSRFLNHSFRFGSCQEIIIEWFAERRHLIDTLLANVDGLDELPRHTLRQEREVKELFGLHESFLANTTTWNGPWLSLIHI